MAGYDRSKRVRRVRRENISTAPWADKEAYKRAKESAKAGGNDHDHIREVERSARSLQGRPRRERLKIHERWRQAGMPTGNDAGNVQPLSPQDNRVRKPEDMRQLDEKLNPKSRKPPVPASQPIPSPGTGRRENQGPTRKIPAAPRPGTVRIPGEWMPTPPGRGGPSYKDYGGWVTGIQRMLPTSGDVAKAAAGVGAALSTTQQLARTLLMIGGL